LLHLSLTGGAGGGASSHGANLAAESPRVGEILLITQSVG
jgi:hypothetical protein